MKPIRSLAAAMTIAALALGSSATPAATMTERGTEAQMLDLVTAQGTLDSSNEINRAMHYPGTPGDRALASWMRDQLQQAGFNAKIESFTFPVYTPKKLVLSLLTNPRADFDLHEARLAGDPDGSRADAGLPFNAGSANGNVTAPVVFVGRGLDADYQALAKAGVHVRGSIALVRYGAQFRGLLAKRAQDNGAAGVLFYNDPGSERRGEPYVDGPNRPLGATQRGTVDGPMQIPVIPVSALTAQRILQDIHGTPSPQAFHGGLAASYDYGTTSAKVHLVVQLQRKTTTLWNTVGVLPGNDSRQEVVVGGHRDAWVFGVTDNGSGISTLVEAARALGYMHRSGWQPQRSIVIAGFDGEEIGEAGSKAYVRDHQSELSNGCVAYINADEVTTGEIINADAVGALADAVTDATHSVADPHQQHQSLYSRWAKQKGGVSVDQPGGGSDFESFLYSFGIPTMEFSFSGPFGVYHSAYDDIKWASTFGDPGFVNHRAEAQMLALFAMRLSQDEVLPYRFTPYVAQMRADVETLRNTGHDRPALGVVSAAIDRFAAAAAHFDAAQNPARNADALAAVKEIDLLIYGVEGYDSVAFPKLAAAEATGSSVSAAADAARTINDATRRLQ